MPKNVKLPSTQTHRFSEVPKADIPRSAFDRTHGYKTTFDGGYLIPFYVDEALPGDTFNMDATLFARLATPIVPFMDNLHMDTFYFAVPLRLIWDNFQKFCGEQTDPDDSTDFLTPQIVAPAGTGWAVGTLSDYFGLPTGIVGLSVASFWHRAYNLIWNEWFRDENLQDSVVVDKDDGPDTNSDYVLLRRGKRHDYFTSCLPWPQKGPGVELPLGTSAPITLTNPSVPGVAVLRRDTTGALSGAIAAAGFGVSADSQLYDSGTGFEYTYDPNGTLIADLSLATAATINSLRQAFQIQKLYERDARGGTRYTEILKAHFQVTSPDQRLQRPEFLGGKSTPIMITPVESNTDQRSGDPGSAFRALGDLAAYGTVVSNREGFTKSFVEHSVIVGLVMVRADLTYQQGVPRMFSRRSRWDFYWPALAHIGEQAVLNQEIYAVAEPNVQNQAVFGYQERWAEYRYFPSKITGQLRSTFAQSLDVWHLAQEFTALPTLSDTFIQEDPPIDRIIATTNYPHFVFDSYIKQRTVRPMPVYSVPGLIDHF